MEQSAQDYRHILQKELTTRCEQNPRYSLRAFARDLKLSPSRLSEILNQKQGLSRPAAQKIASILGYDERESLYFCDLVSIRHARSVKEREEAQVRLLKTDYEKEQDSRFQLQLDAFKIISDWYHLGILELMKCKDFRHDPKWIARRLGIPVIQVELAIERLMRVGLLKFQAGEYVAVQEDGWVPGGVPSASIRKFHKQVLEKAIQAMAVQPVQERFFATHFLTIDRSDLPEAFEAIKDFQRRFCVQFQKDEPKELLYCISMQLFKMVEEGTV
ncbi:MAG: TIGR02147 family protein [Oligoflexus sp.]|jgi:uncharacterized protein (TIGR02147 family)